MNQKVSKPEVSHLNFLFGKGPDCVLVGASNYSNRPKKVSQKALQRCNVNVFCPISGLNFGR